ncbi:MAG: hypothetical protein JSS49_11985 [Planctomycetes bacterium]|nr:hypothetical protein [Planctomycetota bacterium]
MRFWFWICLAVGVVASQAYLWWSAWPLGIPGEWTWDRTVCEPDGVWNMVGAVVALLLYAGFVEAGARRLARFVTRPMRRVEVAGWMLGLVAISFAWLWVVQELAPLKTRLGKAAFVLYYPSSSGYFTKARYENPDARTLLTGYEDLMRERDVLHVGTHPPGLFLVFHGLIEACRSSSALSSFLDATQPGSFAEACDVIAKNSALSMPPRPLLGTDRRVLWLATLLVMAAASMAVLPLYGLIRRTVDPAAAWRTAALWPAVPTVAVFIPKSDVAYALIGLLMTYTWLAAVDRRSLWLAFVTGVLVWLGLMLSLAFLPMILFMVIVGGIDPAGLSTLRESTNDSCADHLRRIRLPPVACISGGLVGFFVPTVLVGAIWHVNLLTVWLLNYQNHAGFYAQYPRTYWKWLLANPVELAFAAGWPLALLSLAVVLTGFRSRRMSPVAIGMLVVWGALWLTGKNSGEAARLWIVFLPWLIWTASSLLAELDCEGTRKWFRPSMAILIVQLAVCALTVARVSGFGP